MDSRSFSYHHSLWILYKIFDLIAQEKINSVRPIRKMFLVHDLGKPRIFLGLFHGIWNNQIMELKKILKVPSSQIGSAWEWKRTSAAISFRFFIFSLEYFKRLCQISRRIRGIFVWSGSELWSLFKYSKLNLKNQNPIAVDDIFKAYQMVPTTLMQIHSGRTVPLT